MVVAMYGMKMKSWKRLMRRGFSFRYKEIPALGHLTVDCGGPFGDCI